VYILYNMRANKGGTMAYNPWQTLSQNISSLGSFLKLPEWNISEKIYASDTPTQTTAPSTGGGGSWGGDVASSTGGITGGIYTAPSTTGTGNVPLQQQPSSGGIDYDAMIAPALQMLDQAIGPAQQGYQENISNIDKSAGLQQQQAQAIGIEGAQTAATAKGTQKKMTESAIDEARRQYSEISQGLQSRYGGTTGTGKFANEIAGGQAMRNIGNQRQALASAVQAIDDKLMQIQEISKMQVLEVQQKAEERKTQARQQLDATLAQIRNAKGELMANKAKYAQDAMQFYQQQVQQVNANNTSFLQQLYLQQQAAEQKLSQAKQTASQKSAELMNLGTAGSPKWSWVNKQSQQITPVIGAGSLNYEVDQKDKEFFQ